MMTDEQFCKIETALTGEPIDRVEQLVQTTMTGRELKEYLEAAFALYIVSKRFEVWSVTHNNMVKSFEHRETAELCINVISSVDTEYEIIEVTVC